MDSIAPGYRNDSPAEACEAGGARGTVGLYERRFVNGGHEKRQAHKYG